MKVAIAGYGQEGESNYHYWSKLGADITIFDEKQETLRPIPDSVPTQLGPDVFNDLNGYDLVVRTAGLNPNHITTDGKIWSSTNEFFAQCPAPIIGVTGTKGKGTTCSLIAEILKSAGKTVHLLGNIGTPALNILPSISKDDIVVFELSSFQLWDLEKSPETAVVLMIEADHLNVHADMEDYVTAKAQIGAFQTEKDLLVYHPRNKFSAQIAALSPAQKRQFMSDEGANVVDGKIQIDGIAICSSSEVGLLGAHNLENICAAITASWKYTQDVAAIKLAVSSFKGLPHRLEFVREVDGVKFYNDSFSSAAGATIAAIKSFTQPTILICGGYDKGIDFDELTTAIAHAQNIKAVILIGMVRHTLAEQLTEKDFTHYTVVDSENFKDSIELAQDKAVMGDVVLLSPGTSSFDMFKNFYDRGDQFKQIVGALS